MIQVVRGQGLQVTQSRGEIFVDGRAHHVDPPTVLRAVRLGEFSPQLVAQVSAPRTCVTGSRTSTAAKAAVRSVSIALA